MAGQFNCPGSGEGMVQAFRREKSIYESAVFKLKCLDADARYTVKDVDTHRSKEMTGHELMEGGVVINMPDRPGAVLITYKKIESNGHVSETTHAL